MRTDTSSSIEAGFGRIGHAVRRLAGSVASLLGRMRQARRRRADTRALTMLDDRLLADLGLKRGDVTAAVYGEVPLRAARPDRRSAEAQLLPALRPQPRTPEKDLGRAA